MTGASRKIWILIYPHPSDAREPQKDTPFPFFLFRRQRVSKGVRSFDFYYLVPPRWRFRFRLHEAIHGGGWRSRLPVVQKAAGFGCAKKTTAEPGYDDGLTPEMRAAIQQITDARVYFAFDKFNIQPEYKDMLKTKAELMKKYPSIRVRIEGNCDDRGTQEYNLALGERRARAPRTAGRAARRQSSR